MSSTIALLYHLPQAATGCKILITIQIEANKTVHLEIMDPITIQPIILASTGVAHDILPYAKET
jgi:hypothetical protein